MTLRYQGNPKHKEPWQPGRRGTLCPPDIILGRARQLLEASVLQGRVRYSADKGRAMCARPDNAGHWHGYPIGWHYVPHDVIKELLARNAVAPREVRDYWEIDP
jgi:filamentous hemagglutinin